MLAVRMRFLSHLLEAVITLVVVFGFLDALLGGSRPSRTLARYSGLAEAEAWVTGFGGTTGWDGSAPSQPAKKTDAGEPSARSLHRAGS
jgi:hypothetical protein